MISWLRSRAIVGAVLAGALLAPIVTAQSRDGARGETGTAMIAGRIVTDDPQPAPVRRATVRLTGGGLRAPRDFVTDDAGRFAFSGLPAGAYGLSASKAAWITTFYGSRHPGVKPFSSEPIQLNDGEPNTTIELRLLHGSAIGGTVVDVTGRPLEVEVEAYQFHNAPGGRTVAWAAGAYSGTMTDDRGVYRLFGLAPGEYVIKAHKTAMGESSHQMTPEVLQAAQQALAKSGAASVPAAPAEHGRTVRYADVYYPGTPDPTAATVIKVGANDDRTDVNFALQLVPTTRISGTVVWPGGRPAARVGPRGGQGPGPTAMIQLIVPWSKTNADGLADAGAAASIDLETEPDGTFAMDAIPPGQYTIVARAPDDTAPARPGAGQETWFLWATQDIRATGHDITDVSLVLQTGQSVSGRVTAPAGIDLSRCVMTLSGTRGNRGAVAADGTFTIGGLVPDRYTMSMMQTGSAKSLAIASAVVGGRDVVDLAFEIHPGESISNLAVKVIDQLGAVSGTLQDAAGKPAANYVIAMFSADRAYWTSKNRRMPPATQTGRDGRYQVGSLPAGDYYVIAAADIDPDALQDPASLAQLAGQAQRITIGDGEKRVLDLKISRIEHEERAPRGRIRKGTIHD